MLQRISIRSFFENMNTKVFFLLLFLCQLIFIFQGIDFLDEGFTATFYQQFFNDPSSVEYNFMFWLSGLIGGTFTYLFPIIYIFFDSAGFRFNKRFDHFFLSLGNF